MSSNIQVSANKNDRLSELVQNNIEGCKKVDEQNGTSFSVWDEQVVDTKTLDLQSSIPTLSIENDLYLNITKNIKGSKRLIINFLYRLQQLITINFSII